jgi:hypothetical protein
MPLVGRRCLIRYVVDKWIRGTTAIYPLYGGYLSAARRTELQIAPYQRLAVPSPQPTPELGGAVPIRPDTESQQQFMASSQVCYASQAMLALAIRGLPSMPPSWLGAAISAIVIVACRRHLHRRSRRSRRGAPISHRARRTSVTGRHYQRDTLLRTTSACPRRRSRPKQTGQHRSG